MYYEWTISGIVYTSAAGNMLFALETLQVKTTEVQAAKPATLAPNFKV